MKITHLVPLTALLFTLGCSSETEGVEAAHTPPVTEKLEPYECGTITRLHTLGGVFLASQPAESDFQDAKDGGVKTVVDLRLADEEREFDEPAVVAGLGLAYHYLGFNTPDSLTDEVFDDVRAILNDPEQKPVLMHCKSANRVGAVWLAHRVLDGGITWEDALAEAKTVGLKSPPFEAKALDYVTRAQADG